MLIQSQPRKLQIVILLCLMAAGTAYAAPPTFGNPSPAGDTSKKANEMADQTLYKPVEYENVKKQGPALVVIPGEIKSNNATFIQKYSANNIADYGELELSKANFKVLERTDMGPLLQEFQLAYTMGNPNQARKYLQKGKFKTTKWVVKFDILKAEPVAAAQKSFDGRTLGNLVGILGRGSIGGAVGGAAVGSVNSGEAASVWVIGMRYKIMDANTTEQMANGYAEEKMEVGATSQSALGASQSAQGGVTLDTMVQRLVQKTVYEIDSKYK